VIFRFLPSQSQPVILVSSPPKALLPDLEPTLHGLGPASGKCPTNRAIKRKPRKPLGSLSVESRSPTRNLRLLLQLLHRGLGKASQSSDRKGMLIFNILFCYLCINSQASMQSASRYPFGSTCKEPCARERVPKGG
jgi:hypothetical protein